jgi:hypothetical protein
MRRSAVQLADGFEPVSGCQTGEIPFIQKKFSQKPKLCIYDLL